MTEPRPRAGLSPWVLVALVIALGGAAAGAFVTLRGGTSAPPAKPASDCDDAGAKKKEEEKKLEKGCPIDTGAFQVPPVVEVPPTPPASAAPPSSPAAGGSADVAAQANSARQKLDQALKSPGFQQVLTRQVHTQLDELDGALHLTPEQKQKLGELLARQAQAGVSMGAAVLGGGDAAAGPDDVFAIQKQIEDLFTPAQRRDYEAYRKAKTEQAREHQRDNEQRSLVNSLGLDAAQRDEVARLVSEAGVVGGPSIGEAEREQIARTKAGSAERQAVIAKLFEHDVEDPALTARLRAVLRPEQFARYEEYLGRKRTQREQVKLLLGGEVAPAATARP